MAFPIPKPSTRSLRLQQLEKINVDGKAFVKSSLNQYVLLIILKGKVN